MFRVFHLQQTHYETMQYMTEIKQLEAMKQLKIMDLKILLKMFWTANPDTESIGQIIETNDSFMNGEIIMLPVMPGDADLALCCLCHQPVDDGEELTTHFEYKLRLHPILSNSTDTFGIVFNYAEENAPYQMVCDDCLTSRHDSPEGQRVSFGLR